MLTTYGIKLNPEKLITLDLVMLLENPFFHGVDDLDSSF